MSELAEGKLTLPTGAVKNVSEISDAVKVGVANVPAEGGDKLIQEKHLKDLESAFTGEVDRLDGELAAEVSRADCC
jgi:hypothetical protein